MGVWMIIEFQSSSSLNTLNRQSVAHTQKGEHEQEPIQASRKSEGQENWKINRRYGKWRLGSRLRN